jgi:cytochrome P450
MRAGPCRPWATEFRSPDKDPKTMASPSLDAAIPQDIANTLVDRSAYADDRAQEAFRWLRANNPLGLATPDGFDPMWVVTKHADIMAIGSQNKLFANGDKQIILTSQDDMERVYKMRANEERSSKNLIQMDPPQHAKYRLMTQSWFLPQNLRKIEGDIRATARRYVDRLLATGGKCDFVETVALGFPMNVIMTILGVPEEDEPLMHKLTQQIFAQDDQSGGADAASAAERASNLKAATMEFALYFGKLAEDRRRNPRDDLATVIANAKLDGEPIPQREELGYYIIIATAGHDTTTNGSAGSMLSMCQNPVEFAKLKADPSLIPAMIEESIRWTTPVKHFMRSAKEDTEVNGRMIAKGDLLMLSYYSANRDEDVFEAPYTFRIDRQSNKHIAFGHGAHVCLGQLLARMELRILWEELLPRIKSIGLYDEPRYHTANFINGPNYIPLTFEAA